MQLENMFSTVGASFKQNRSIILASLALPMSILFLAVMILKIKGIAIGFLTRDPNAICGNPYYAGFISQFGIFFWAGAAVICLFTYYLLIKQSIKSEMQPLLLFAGIFTLFLGADDVFQLHDGFFPHIGISEKLVLVCYASLMVYFLLRFRALILKTNFLLLLMALFFFGLSLIVDVLWLFQSIRHLLEDGFKLMGIVAWAFYFAEVCSKELSPR